MSAENQTSHCHEFSDNGEYEVACGCGLHIDATPPRELVEEARQMAFETGGLEGGEYHLADDELEQIIQHVISQTIVDREVNFHDEQPRWIPVGDRLPSEDQGTVAVLFDDGHPGVGWATYWHGARTDFAEWTFPLDELGEDRTVTHWMPLPASPGSEP